MDRSTAYHKAKRAAAANKYDDATIKRHASAAYAKAGEEFQRGNMQGHVFVCLPCGRTCISPAGVCVVYVCVGMCVLMTPHVAPVSRRMLANSFIP
jgi:rubrerythrin